MTIPRLFAKKRDQNERDIVLTARTLGARIWRIDTPCDLLMLFAGRWFAVEVKARKGRLTPDQLEFYRSVQEGGGQVLTWKSIDDVARDLNALRQRSWRSA